MNLILTSVPRKREQGVTENKFLVTCQTDDCSIGVSALI